MAIAPDSSPLSGRALDVLEWGAKAALALLGMWGFLEKVAKPYTTWRRKHIATQIREALRPELDRMERLSGCADRIELVLRRQDHLFKDIDDFLVVARTNTERIDETNDLLDEVFHLDRRVNPERRAHIDSILAGLARRQQDRRRDADDPPAVRDGPISLEENR